VRSVAAFARAGDGIPDGSAFRPLSDGFSAAASQVSRPDHSAQPRSAAPVAIRTGRQQHDDAGLINECRIRIVAIL